MWIHLTGLKWRVIRLWWKVARTRWLPNEHLMDVFTSRWICLVFAVMTCSCFPTRTRSSSMVRTRRCMSTMRVAVFSLEQSAIVNAVPMGFRFWTTTSLGMQSLVFSKCVFHHLLATTMSNQSSLFKISTTYVSFFIYVMSVFIFWRPYDFWTTKLRLLLCLCPAFVFLTVTSHVHCVHNF